MLSKFLFALMPILLALIFSFNSAAQTVAEGTDAVTGSKLMTINLPEGARRVKDGLAPAEVTELLQKLIAQGGDRVRQGNSEVLLWGGDYETPNDSQMVQKLETELKKSGWQYEIAAKEQGVTIFMLLREEPSKRALIGFFAPTKEAFFFAVTEMLPAGGAQPGK